MPRMTPIRTQVRLVPSACALALLAGGCPGARHDAPTPSDGGRLPVDAAAASDGRPSSDGPDPDAAPASRDGLGDGPAPDPVERVVALVLAAPDLPPQYVCLVSLAVAPGGEPMGEPLLAGGPFGAPDPSDPTGQTLRSGFPYGTVVKLPFFVHDRMYFEGLRPIGFVVDDVDLHQTVRGGSSEPCKRAWAGVRDVPGRQVALGSVEIGASFLASVTGCRDSSAAPECAGGANLATTLRRLDTSALPTAGGSGGDDGVAVQVANLSAAADLQGVDFFLQPVRVADGGATIPEGEPLALTREGLSRGEISAAGTLVHVAAFDPGLTRLLVVPHGAPCSSDDGCTALSVLIEPFRARYAAPAGGGTGAAWDGHQVLALLGGGPMAGDPGALGPLRLAMFRSTFVSPP